MSADASAQLVNPPAGTYFEDFAPGQLFRHMRGKTAGEIDVVLLAQMVMNTAEGHFNADAMTKVKFGRRVAFGGVTASIVVGLASEDTAENALAELGISKLRLRTPVVEGDTLYAVTETLSVEPSDRPEAGIVTFRHFGINQKQEFVCEIERRVLIRRRGAAA
jgi:itaconyl-CoA hydratase